MDDVFGQFEQLFGSLFGNPAPPRVAPVVVPSGYRGAASGAKDVRVVVWMPCAPCRGRGCRACERVGWTVREMSVSVDVPASATEGADVTPPRAPKDGSRPIVFRVFHPGPAADEHLECERDEERALRARWSQRRDERRAELRRATWRAILVLGGLVGFLGAVLGYDYARRARTNEPCAVDGDCRSRMCLTLREPVEGGFLPMATVVGHVCTETCKADDDCPSSMKCAPAVETMLPSFVGNETPTELVCSPRSR